MSSKQKVLISLIGHQPLPILMTIRHEKPNHVSFISSSEQSLILRKQNLVKLSRSSETQVLDFGKDVDPWNLLSISQNLDDFIFDHELESAQLLFDITGGTKPMSIGLTYTAISYIKKGWDVKLIYLESESRSPKLSYYTIDNQGLLSLESQQVVNASLDIQDFWIAYQGKKPQVGKRSSVAKGTPFEEDLEKELLKLKEEGLIDEVLATVLPPEGSGEIDFVLRKKSRFALVECKSGGEATGIGGIYSLSNWASDKYLGTYTSKLLAVTSPYPKENSDVAQAHDVTVLELSGWSQTARSLEHHSDKIRQKIWEVFKYEV